MNFSDFSAQTYLASRAPKAEVFAGSVDRFAATMDRYVGGMKKLDKAVEATFYGLAVKENPLLPPNRVVLLVNGDVKAIIDLDKADDLAHSG